jgi:hypothetical protein
MWKYTHFYTQGKKKTFETKILEVEEEIMMEITLGSPFASLGLVDIFKL